MVASAQFMLQVAKLSKYVYCWYLLLNIHGRIVNEAYGMNSPSLTYICKQDGQYYYTYYYRANGEDSQCVKMAHDICLGLKFGSTIGLLIWFFCYASCRLYNIVFFDCANGCSNSLGPFFLNLLLFCI